MSLAVWLALLAGLAASLPVQASTDPGNNPAEEVWLARFSAMEPGGAPSEFKNHRLPKIKRQTVYRLVASERGTVLRADSSNSASALIRKVRIDPDRFPWLEWSWKIEGALPEARWREKTRDDFAARVFLMFKGGRGPFSFINGLVMKMAGALPGRALNYVWAGPEGEGIAPSPYTDKVMMVAQRSAGQGEWHRERRNVIEDYRRAFGGKARMVVGIAVMTDTDNTRGEATAYYGDIRLLSDPPANSW